MKLSFSKADLAEAASHGGSSWYVKRDLGVQALICNEIVNRNR